MNKDKAIDIIKEQVGYTIDGYKNHIVSSLGNRVDLKDFRINKYIENLNQLVFKIKSLKKPSTETLQFFSDTDLLFNGDGLYHPKFLPGKDMKHETVDHKGFLFPFDVKEIYVFEKSDEDEPEWNVIGKMERKGLKSFYFYIQAWHDYTGFDCRGGYDITLSYSKDKLTNEYNDVKEKIENGIRTDE